MFAGVHTVLTYVWPRVNQNDWQIIMVPLNTDNGDTIHVQNIVVHLSFKYSL